VDEELSPEQEEISSDETTIRERKLIFFIAKDLGVNY